MEFFRSVKSLLYPQLTMNVFYLCMYVCIMFGRYCAHALFSPGFGLSACVHLAARFRLILMARNKSPSWSIICNINYMYRFSILLFAAGPAFNQGVFRNYCPIRRFRKIFGNFLPKDLMTPPVKALKCTLVQYFLSTQTTSSGLLWKLQRKPTNTIKNLNQ